MAQLGKMECGGGGYRPEVTGQTRVRSREVSIFFKFLEGGGFGSEASQLGVASQVALQVASGPQPPGVALRVASGTDFSVF